jgi:hypothetical protein
MVEHEGLEHRSTERALRAEEARMSEPVKVRDISRTSELWRDHNDRLVLVAFTSASNDEDEFADVFASDETGVKGTSLGFFNANNSSTEDGLRSI